MTEGWRWAVGMGTSWPFYQRLPLRGAGQTLDLTVVGAEPL